MFYLRHGSKHLSNPDMQIHYAAYWKYQNINLV